MEESKRKHIRESLENLREKNKKNFSKYFVIIYSFRSIHSWILNRDYGE